MPKRRKSRIYPRTRGGITRYYIDVRDLGGGREALIPPGSRRATNIPDVAQELAACRVRELERQQRRRTLLGIRRTATLGSFAAHHLVEKKRAGRVTDRWLEDTEVRLQRAVDFFGAKRELTTIAVEDMNAWMAHLQMCVTRNGKGFAPGTIRHHLNVVSNLFRRAQAEGVVLPGYNPVAALMDKPTANHEESKWFESDEAALLLQGGKHYHPSNPHLAVDFAYPMIATLLYTGGRKAEVCGLETDDVSFDRKTITFRPNAWRRLKTATSHRSVRLFPDLEAILQRHIFGSHRPPGRLLFPSYRSGKERMMVELRKILDGVAQLAGWKAGEVRCKMLRHTFTAARLQCLDRGAPISVYTVARELGHGGEQMVRRIYGHLGEVRHRSEDLEYRVDPSRKEVAERYRAMATH